MQDIPLSVSNRSNYSSMQVQHSPRSDPTLPFPSRQEMSTKMVHDSIPMSNMNPSYSNPSYHSPRSDLGPPPRQEITNHSPRSDLGPQIRKEIPYHEQYIAKSQLQASAREMVPPRGAYSTPQMQAYPSSQSEQQEFVQVRGIFSIPIVGQQVNQNQPENLSQTQKSIFSYSHSVPHINPPHSTMNQLNQPMNLPFFSTGDGPQQEGVLAIHSTQNNLHEAQPQPPSSVQRGTNQKTAEYQKNQNPATNQRSLLNQRTKSAAKQASHIYNPSFFTKLGVWK